MENVLWSPSESYINNTLLKKFIEHSPMPSLDYDALHSWSLHEPAAFWSSVWDFCHVIGHKGKGPYLKNSESMEQAEWFPDARLNFAENVLRRRDEGEALVFWSEDGKRRSLSFKDLYDKVSQLRQGLQNLGIEPGDRVAGFMPHMPETIIAMLATTSLGAIWTACSPDFGFESAFDRLHQVTPKVLIGVDGYFYNGKTFSTCERLDQLVKSIPTLNHTILVSYAGLGESLSVPHTPLVQIWSTYAPHEIEFDHFPFDHPLYILFSSGTTGVPKCIVHGAGGTLLQHLKEHQLHCDIKPDDRVFYYTTCSWMMWHWQVSALASRATLLLYDGSPTYPTVDRLFDIAARERMTLFGTSAKYIDHLRKEGAQPIKSYDLKALRMMTSTGSPLAPESFDYVYSSIKKDLCLASISGGTDIVSCFVLGCPVLPVHRGEIQVKGLGMAVEIWDEDGQSVVGQKGELVCIKPFPSMPVKFWNDGDGTLYHQAYFDRFPHVWCHGDFAEITDTGGLIIYGRSDALLNPGGVRIGTAEIYRPVEELEEVLESLVIGQDWDHDVRIILFVRLREGLSLTPDLIKKIKDHIRHHATPRHVPAFVIQVPDIPKTKNGKIAELAVKRIVQGEEVKNVNALANPDCLAFFKELSVLK